MKVKSGIPGLDNLLYGGIPERSIVLLSGAAGTGKTIFSLQFLMEGARLKERGVYLTFEELPEKIYDQGKQFGWDFQALEKKGLVKVVSISSVNIVDILIAIRDLIRDFKPRRMAIDSITYMSLVAHATGKIVDLEKTSVAEVYGQMLNTATPLESDGLAVRKMITDFVKIIQQRNITALLTSEIQKDSVWYSRDTMSEFACDGILHLKAISIGGDLQRTIEVVKMRNSKIRGGIYSYELTDKGAKIKL